MPWLFGRLFWGLYYLERPNPGKFHGGAQYLGYSLVLRENLGFSQIGQFSKLKPHFGGECSQNVVTKWFGHLWPLRAPFWPRTVLSCFVKFLSFAGCDGREPPVLSTAPGVPSTAAWVRLFGGGHTWYLLGTYLTKTWACMDML